ncbi:MAG: ABC transporter ATP-binding protein [Acidobacteriia bacterium]|nr:ABC transporter ATP-binding protein [Terriglobia bacterium]
MAGNEYVIKLDSVSRVYRQGDQAVHALDHVSLRIRPGEMVVVAGPSGSGKTTLLNVAGGLDRPTEGKVWLEEHDLTSMSRRALAQLRLHAIGFVFQAYNLIPVLSAEENAEFILLLRGVPAAARRAKVRAALEAVGLQGLEHRRPHQLSGGQQQRVAVARAIVAEPALVLADEPTANLDSVAATALLDLMVILNREQGTTFLFSTHDPRVMQRARRVIKMMDGRIASDETIPKGDQA